MEDSVSLRDYIEARLSHLEDTLAHQKELNLQHFSLNQLAIDKAEEKITDKLEGMNQFRDQIREERLNLATKDSVIGLEKSIRVLELSGAKIAGKADQSEVFTTKLIAIVSIIIGLTGVILSIIR